MQRSESVTKTLTYIGVDVSSHTDSEGLVQRAQGGVQCTGGLTQYCDMSTWERVNIDCLAFL